VWQTLWLTPQDAAAFAKAMRSWLTQRYDVKPINDEAGQLKLEALGRHIRLVTNREGTGVLLIDAASAAFAEAAAKL
jgi:hypothetical protein